MHEYAHGISDRAMGWGDITLDNQVGALHEFFADFVTMVVDVSFRGVNAHHSWRIGEGLWTGNSAWALRSNKSPVFDLQSSIHGNWFPFRQLWGGDAAEQNATIAGHAYYLSIFGGQHEEVGAPHIPDLTVPPLSTAASTSESRARQIFLRALQDNTMASAPTFKKLKTAAMAHANTLYGAPARTSVMTAFDAVGVCHSENAPPSSAPDVAIFDLMCHGRFNTTWPSMPGVTRYFAEVSPAQFGFALSTPVSDDVVGENPPPTNQCLFQITSPMVYHIRACNSCGCGPWSETEYLPYWSPCP